MTIKSLSILFAIVMMGMLSFPAHAQVNSLLTPSGSIVESVVVTLITSDTTTIDVTVTFAADIVLANSTNIRVDFEVTDNVNPSRNKITNSILLDNSVGSFNPDTTRPVELKNDGNQRLDFTVGTKLTIKYTVLTQDSTTGNYTESGSTTLPVITVQAPRECGYQTLPDIEYPSTSRDETSTAFFTPSITNATQFDQPTTIDFVIGDFKNGVNAVIVSNNTSINGTSGPNVKLTNVLSDDTFEFQTLLNFTDQNAYVTSIGKKITQTTTIAYTCS